MKKNICPLPAAMLKGRAVFEGKYANRLTICRGKSAK